MAQREATLAPWRRRPGRSVVFQCRGQASVLAEALRCLWPQGTVDLAFYPGDAEPLRLGEGLHHKRMLVNCDPASLWQRKSG